MEVACDDMMRGYSVDSAQGFFDELVAYGEAWKEKFADFQSDIDGFRTEVYTNSYIQYTIYYILYTKYYILYTIHYILLYTIYRFY